MDTAAGFSVISTSLCLMHDDSLKLQGYSIYDIFVNNYSTSTTARLLTVHFPQDMLHDLLLSLMRAVTSATRVRVCLTSNLSSLRCTVDNLMNGFHQRLTVAVLSSFQVVEFSNSKLWSLSDSFQWNQSSLVMVNEQLFSIKIQPLNCQQRRDRHRMNFLGHCWTRPILYGIVWIKILTWVVVLFYLSFTVCSRKDCRLCLTYKGEINLL